MQIKKYAFVFMVFSIHTFILVLLALFTNFETTTYVHPTHTFFDHFFQWDAQWYVYIGRYGYLFPSFVQHLFIVTKTIVPFSPSYQAIAFFPLVPLLVHFLGAVGALFFGNAIFLLTLYLFYGLLEKSTSKRMAKLALLFFAFNPVGVFESALYGGIYVVFFTLLIIKYIRKERNRDFIVALFSILLCSLSYKLGIVSVVFACTYFRKGAYVKGMIFSFAACVPWFFLLIYSKIKFHELFAIFNTEKTWGRVWSFPFFPLVRELMGKINPFDCVYYVLLTALIFCVLFSMFCEIKRKHEFFSIELFLWVVFYAILCWSTMNTFISPLKSVVRFLSLIFPMYVFIWLPKNERISNALLFSLSILFFGGFLFSAFAYLNGFFVA